MAEGTALLRSSWTFLDPEYVRRAKTNVKLLHYKRKGEMRIWQKTVYIDYLGFVYRIVSLHTLISRMEQLKILVGPPIPHKSKGTGQRKCSLWFSKLGTGDVTTQVKGYGPEEVQSLVLQVRNCGCDHTSQKVWARRSTVPGSPS
jgi:hypothetical protein